MDPSTFTPEDELEPPLPLSPLGFRLAESLEEHGDEDVTIHYSGFKFEAHLAVLRAKSKWFDDYSPGDTIELSQTCQVALEPKFHCMEDGFYSLNQGDMYTRPLEKGRMLCEQQDEIHEIADDFRIKGLTDFALRKLREQINRALFQSDANQYTTLALGVLCTSMGVLYKETAHSGNDLGSIKRGTHIWPTRDVVLEAATRLLAMSKDLVDEGSGENTQRGVRKGLAVMADAYPIFGAELMVCLLEREVSFTLGKKFGKVWGEGQS